MKVLQLIDSLRLGGAEKMSVSYANALAERIEGSFLCCTRLDGFLKEELHTTVNYVFLNKKSILDTNAIFKLKNFIKYHNIDVVQAHGSSYFIASLVKMLWPNFKLVWHVHNGASEQMNFFELNTLKFLSRFFDGIITVNISLSNWAKENLNCKNVIDLPNFVLNNSSSKVGDLTLKGEADAFKIICVANLRPEKDYSNLIKAFKEFAKNKNVSLHIIGNDLDTLYSEKILKELENSGTNKKMFYYGSRRNVIFLLKQADLGVISSRSEGLPVALLEYGLAGLCVVSTDVGHCKDVIKNNGIVVGKEDHIYLSKAFNTYYSNRELAKTDALKFHNDITKKYSPSTVVSRLIEFYNSILITN
ncbi:Glycosyltransferase involved in cell wall bisynthesis [Gillisia sp. Hel1_33_143]|uniref:glycosyltransferase family 4 protein n=1 Tax=Gillisia sp. Hel1_33_143 TaxID=1336796 RepID=UPI00087B7A3A|nr:glycosyltransferase family 4 protein [Gillisia sp. Hel1_33_143]SDS24503.1 Glycosyltransferase involved in cell wall bisynthesis [Gillisia sp. Hel1_33_143]